MPLQFGPDGLNTNSYTNPINGSYYPPGTTRLNPNYNASDPNSQKYTSGTTPSSPVSNGPATSLGPVPQQNNFANTGYGLNAQQLAATGNANPQSLGAASIQSSSPPYSPVVTPQQSQAVQGTMLQNASGNGLNPNEQFSYTPINPNGNGQQLQNSGQVPLNVAVGTQTGTAQTANPQYNPNNAELGYNAVNSPGAQGSVDPNSLVENNFNRINQNSPVDQNGVPLWATTAVTAARQQMAALGLGSSTMAGNATAAAILNTELPMAQQDAQTFANINSQNLQNLQQTLLSNQAAQNAAAQFNAQNTTQNNQFFSNLGANIAQFNASQANAMTQFNSQQTNSMSQFLANMQSQREEFNAQNQLLVDQSNVQWQRAVNTANTAGTNSANQANVQNTFNLTQTALNNEWQMIQDQASWALSAGENSQNRGLTLATSAMNQQTALSILNSQLSAQTFSQLGNFAANLFGGASGIGNSLTKGINSLFGNNNSGGYNLGNYTGGSFTNNTDLGNYFNSIGLGNYGGG